MDIHDKASNAHAYAVMNDCSFDKAVDALYNLDDDDTKHQIISLCDDLDFHIGLKISGQL